MRQGPPLNQPIEPNGNSRQALGLVGWWPMLASQPSGLTAYDRSGRSAHGALLGSTGTPTFVSDGEMGRVLSFTAANSQYVSLGTPPTLNLPGIMSAFAWIKPATVAANPIEIICDCNAAASALQYDLEINRSAGKISVLWANGKLICTSNTAITTTAWWHIGFTRNSPPGDNSWRCRMYRNGIDDGGTPAAVGFNPGALNGVAIGRLGAYNAAYYGGLMADVRLYNRCLSPGEVWQLYDPATRWELYAPVRRVWALGTAGAPAATARSFAVFVG